MCDTHSLLRYLWSMLQGGAEGIVRTWMLSLVAWLVKRYFWSAQGFPQPGSISHWSGRDHYPPEQQGGARTCCYFFKLYVLEGSTQSPAGPFQEMELESGGY